MSIKWHLERRKLADLTPYYKNPRRFTDSGMRDLDKSIDKIGMAQPINVNLHDVILSGHARYEVLKKRGEVEVDVMIPNRELTKEEEEQIVIRMNKNIAGDWDYDILADRFEIPDLLDYGFLDAELGIGDDFEPTSEDKQGELDKKKKTKCPKCGYEF